nr:kelch-like protein 35 [Zootoca vivipara]
MKQESQSRTGGSDHPASLGQGSENLHVKLCSGSRHAEQILQTLNSYRLDGIFTDVVLATGGQEFPCHRAALSASIPYFRALFAGGAKEARQGTVHLREVSAPSMSLVLDYIYGGDLLIQEDNVEDLLELSSFLQIPRLKDACVAFLEGQLHPRNCLGIMKVANSFSIPSLTERSKRCLLEGFVEVSRHKEFLELGVKELASCLSSERLAVPKEEWVFEAVMRWVYHDVAARKRALKDLLQHVRLPLLDPVYFLERVETDELIQESKECIPLLLEARKYYVQGREASSQRSRPRSLSGVISQSAAEALLGYCAFRGHLNSRDVWVLSSQLNVWMKVACLQKGRWRHKMAAFQGKIYTVGGCDGFRCLASVECYDAFSNSWADVAPLPEAVSLAAVVPCLDKLYVIGGAVEDGANTDKVQCYDPEENKWIILSAAPFRQRCISAVALDHSIYVVGGLLSKIFSYSPQKDTWAEVASLPGPQENCGVTVCSGKIYILGGTDKNEQGTDKVFAFDAETGVVEPETPLQRCTSCHGCVTILRSRTR